MARLALSLVFFLVFPIFAFPQDIGTRQERTHEVVSGESLWVISQRYYGDPYKWPLIFEANRATIQDPDAITPGQVLIIPHEDQRAAAAGASAGATVQGLTVTTPAREAQEEARPFIRLVAPPVAEASRTAEAPARTIFYAGRGGEAGSRTFRRSAPGRTTFFSRERVGATPTRTASVVAVSDPDSDLAPVPGGLVLGADWLEREGTEPAALGSLVGYSEGQGWRSLGSGAHVHDRVRIQVEGSEQLRVGDLLQSFRVDREEEGLGTVVRPTGLLSVTGLGDGVEAEVTAQFGRVRMGDKVRLAPPYGLWAGARAVPVSSNVTASLMGFAVDRVMQGIGALAFLDVGEDEGISIGDEFRAFETRPGASFGMESATLQVVLVHGDVSTARVIKLKRGTLDTGDRLRLVKKMQ
jgi:LysM repeat protein